MQPPIARKLPKKLIKHNHTRIDSYYWLNERENSEVIEYLKAENAYTEHKLAHTKTFQEDLFTEIKSRIKEDDTSVPYRSNGYYYYSRFEEGKEYSINCRKLETLDAEEESFLDENELAKNQAYFALGGMSVSPNNKLLVYGTDLVSRRIYTLYFKNLETGELLADQLENTTGGAVWADDNQTLFYTQKDEKLRGHKIFRHTLGTDQSEDEEIYHEKDETFSTFVYKTKSKKYIVIGSYSTLSTEFRLLLSSNPLGTFELFQPREDKHEYGIAHHKDKFYVLTNEGALNFKLMETSEAATQKENWKEIIAHRENVLIENIEVFDDFLVVDEREDGLTKIRIINQRDKSEHYLDFGEETYMAYIGNNPEMNTNILRFGYSSLTTPSSVFDYNMESQEKTMMKQHEVLGTFNPDDYQSERIYVTARDGAKVPVSLVYRKGIQKEGNNPLLQYAYGSYGHSIDPYFSSVRLSLLDRGFIFAISHIRGGEDLGRKWYDDGKLLNKKNTFNDFIDCSKYLIEKKYTSPEQLFAMGGSAGGLLMGVIANDAPELYKGVVASVPFVDVVTTMLDDSIPLTTGEYDEWGNPHDKEYYDYILSYSPYDNVVPQEYPNLLITTGLHDSQVQYWEPAKWVAKLRDVKKGDSLLLLHTNIEAGHGGASGRFEQFKETAMEYAFMLDLAGIKN